MYTQNHSDYTTKYTQKSILYTVYPFTQLFLSCSLTLVLHKLHFPFCSFSSEHDLKDHKAEKHKLALICEICDFKAQTKKVLEIHLVTCKIYKCGKCEYKSRCLSSVKTHILKQHGKGDHTLNHLKMDRTKVNEVCNSIHSLNTL